MTLYRIWWLDQTRRGLFTWQRVAACAALFGGLVLDASWGWIISGRSWMCRMLFGSGGDAKCRDADCNGPGDAGIAFSRDFQVSFGDDASGTRLEEAAVAHNPDLKAAMERSAWCRRAAAREVRLVLSADQL